MVYLVAFCNTGSFEEFKTLKEAQQHIDMEVDMNGHRYFDDADIEVFKAYRIKVRPQQKFEVLDEPDQ